MKEMTFQEFKNYHYANKHDGLRLGQRFVSMFIKKEWPDLFYEEDDNKSLQMIRDYMEDIQSQSILRIY